MLKIRTRITKGFVSLCLIALCSSMAVAQSESEFLNGHPERYVVKEGDTLWDIAKKFLRDPWRWPHIWRDNEQIANPHLIFPGDLLVVTSDNRIKVVRLEPKVYQQALDRAIPTIPPNVIQPFLTSALIVEAGELEKSGHVVSGVEDELNFGKYSKFYARDIEDTSAEEYRLFRVGRELYDPESGELLGIEGIHLGDARMDRVGEDVSKLQVISSNQEIRASDRLVPILEETPLPYYQPHSSSEKLTGWILYAPQGVREVGRFDVVIITGGSEDGMEEGHVLKALWHRGKSIDATTGESYEIPDEESGLMLVFRVFDRLSYALVMEANRAISVGDRYESP